MMREKRLPVDAAPVTGQLPDVIYTKKGKALNVTLLSEREKRRIAAQRRLQPLAAADELSWRKALAKGTFAFSASDETGEKRTVSFAQTNKDGHFQGAYRLRDKRFVVFRSVPGAEGSLVVNSVIDGVEQSGEEIVATFEVERERERQFDEKGRSFEIADFYLPEVRGGKERDYRGSGTYAPTKGTDSYVGHGIASHAFEKLEANASARGASVMRIETNRPDIEALVKHQGYAVNRELTEELDTEGCAIWEKKLAKAPPTADMERFHSFLVVKDGKKQDVAVPVLHELDEPPQPIAEHLQGSSLDWYRYAVDLPSSQVDPYYPTMARLENRPLIIGGSGVVSLMLGKARSLNTHVDMNYVGRKSSLEHILEGWREYNGVSVPPFKDRHHNSVLSSVTLNPESSFSLAFFIKNAKAGKPLSRDLPFMNVPFKHRAFAHITPDGEASLVFRTRKDYADYASKTLSLPDTSIDDELSWTAWNGKHANPKDRDDLIVNTLIYSADVYARGKDEGWRFDDDSLAFLRHMAGRLPKNRHREIRQRVYEDIGEEQPSRRNVDGVLTELGVKAGAKAL